MRNYTLSGLVNNYRVKINIFDISTNHAIKVFQQKYPFANDINIIQDLFRNEEI